MNCVRLPDKREAYSGRDGKIESVIREKELYKMTS